MRDAAIPQATWRDIVFRHDRDTKYALTGKHAQAKCDSCHTGHVYRDKLAADCHSCHRKDDKHREQLGRQCEQCHDAVDWKKTLRFDHDKSRFPLLGRHARVECKSCHATPAYKDAKRECVACHAKDDKHKRQSGHRLRGVPQRARLEDLGLRSRRRTRFALDGAHRTIACVACHKASGEKVPPLAMSCVACHRADDIHGGRFGAQCDRCHETRTWREIKSLGRTSAAPPPRSGQLGAMVGVRS